MTSPIGRKSIQVLHTRLQNGSMPPRPYNRGDFHNRNPKQDHRPTNPKPTHSLALVCQLCIYAQLPNSWPYICLAYFPDFSEQAPLDWLTSITKTFQAPHIHHVGRYRCFSNIELKSVDQVLRKLHRLCKKRTRGSGPSGKC